MEFRNRRLTNKGFYLYRYFFRSSFCREHSFDPQICKQLNFTNG